jgi:hypothetical protein
MSNSSQLVIFRAKAYTVWRRRPVAGSAAHFPHFGDRAGFAVALPFGSNWNSLFNC